MWLLVILKGYGNLEIFQIYILLIEGGIFFVRINWDVWPRLQQLSQYCSGAAYLITPSLIPKFLRATEEVAPIARDDVYMTGVVREHLGISPFYLNQRYTYELDRPIKWVVSKKTQPLPFIFVVSNSKDSR